MLMEVPDRWSDVLLEPMSRHPTRRRSRLSDLSSTSRSSTNSAARNWQAFTCGNLIGLLNSRQQDHWRPKHRRRDSRQSGRRMPLHGHHERLRRRRSRARSSPKAASATPTATALPSSSTAGGIRSSSSAGRPASSPTSRPTPTTSTIAAAPTDDRSGLGQCRRGSDHDPFDLYRADPNCISTCAACLFAWPRRRSRARRIRRNDVTLDWHSAD